MASCDRGEPDWRGSVFTGFTANFTNSGLLNLADTGSVFA